MADDGCLELLEQRWLEGRYLCVGLDPDPDRLPRSVQGDSLAQRVLAFNRAVIESTADVVAAYKPNSAFYEALGTDGIACLQATIEAIRKLAPGVPVVLDAKRADIGNTSVAYATSVFDFLGADAVTVHPYLGRDALMPFLERRSKVIFVLVKTSNPGAGELQDLRLHNGSKLFLHVAGCVANWNEHGNCGVVVGATYANDLKEVRSLTGRMPILVPGVGAQGGDAAEALKAALRSGGGGAIVNVSRSVLYASSEADYAQAARGAALDVHQELSTTAREGSNDTG